MALGSLSIVVALATSIGRAVAPAAARIQEQPSFGVLVQIGLLPLDECDNPTKVTAALVTLDGTVIPRPLAHFGFPRPLGHPDWWMESRAHGMDLWRLSANGKHRFWWSVHDAYVPARWSPSGQRVALRGERDEQARFVGKEVIADLPERAQRDLRVPPDWDIRDVAWIDERRMAVLYVKRLGLGATSLAIVHNDRPGVITTLPYKRLTPNRGHRDGMYPGALDWSPATHRLFLLDGDQGWIIDVGHLRSVRIPGALNYSGSWSPDGQRLLLWRAPHADARLLEATSLRAHRVPAITRSSQFVWMPGGHRLVAEIVRADEQQLVLIGGDGRVERTIPVRWPTDEFGFSLASAPGDASSDEIWARPADWC
jgi:hypothetical protein